MFAPAISLLRLCLCIERRTLEWVECPAIRRTVLRSRSGRFYQWTRHESGHQFTLQPITLNTYDPDRN